MNATKLDFEFEFDLIFFKKKPVSFAIFQNKQNLTSNDFWFLFVNANQFVQHIIQKISQNMSANHDRPRS